MPPNSPSCVGDTNGSADSTDNLLSASRYHAGGVHCLMADGAVRLIANSINTGNLTLSSTNTASPYGVWGALGTKSGDETTGAF